MTFAEVAIEDSMALKNTKTDKLILVPPKLTNTSQVLKTDFEFTVRRS